MGQNIFKSPKAKVLAVAPKATCKQAYWGGPCTIRFGQEVKGFNGETITELKLSTRNPADAWADAWAEAVFELRPDGFNRPHP